MITATVQIVLDVILHGYLEISHFNLIVFDECHRAQKDHPMQKLMRLFEKYDEDEQPRVIGLTGTLTPPSTKPQNILDDLNRLEKTFRATITTAKGESFTDVLMHSTCPEETIIIYETNCLDDSHKSIFRKIDGMKQLIESWDLGKTKFGSICDEFSDHLVNLGMYLNIRNKL